jgi:hypothetical protein
MNGEFYDSKPGRGSCPQAPDTTMGLIAKSDAGPASLQRLEFSCRAPGLWGHARGNSRAKPIHAGAEKRMGRGRFYRGQSAGVGLRGRKTPGTHCACAKRTRQSTRRARCRGQGRVRKGYKSAGRPLLIKGAATFIESGLPGQNKNPRDPITGPGGFVKLSRL